MLCQDDKGLKEFFENDPEVVICNTNTYIQLFIFNTHLVEIFILKIILTFPYLALRKTRIDEFPIHGSYMEVSSLDI